MFQIDYSSIERHHFAFFIALLSTLISCIISFIHIHKHFSTVIDDSLRRHTIRILIMIPFYSLESFFDLYFKHYPGGSVFREAYESVVIWSSYCLLISLLGGELQIKRILSKRYYSICDGGMAGFRMGFAHPFFFKIFLKPILTPDDFLVFCRAGILQYVPLKFDFFSILYFKFRVMTSITMFFCERYGVWHEGEFRVDSGYLWCAFINNFSQILAIYALLFFWKGFNNELLNFRPALKLFCIKGVVFFSWWQSIILSILVHYGIIQPTVTYSKEQISIGLQDFMICLEMLGFSIAHMYAFPVTDENYIVHPNISSLRGSPHIEELESDHESQKFTVANFSNNSYSMSQRKSGKSKQEEINDYDESIDDNSSDDPLLPNNLIIRSNANQSSEIIEVAADDDDNKKSTHFQKVINAFNPKDIVMDLHTSFIVNKDSAFSQSIDNVMSNLKIVTRKQTDYVPLAVTIAEPAQPQDH